MSEATIGSKEIVVGVDGSDSSLRALEWAARHAELGGCSVTAVITWKWPVSFGYPMPVSAEFDPAAEAGKVVESAVARVSSQHDRILFKAEVEEGDPAAVLVARSKGAELLVVGNRGHHELAGLLLGSVSEYCVTHSHCPVVVVRGDTAT